MKLTGDEYILFQELVGEYYDLHPELQEIYLDANNIPFEYRDGYKSYDSFGPTTKKNLNQLEAKVKSLL